MENQMEICKMTGRRKFLLILLSFCLFIIPAPLLSQNYPTRHFTMREGLPGMAVRCIYKDTRGLLWIGTDAGLCTFDGKSFRIFMPSEGMTANQVWSIAEDEQGNMWFGSYGEGLYKYDGRHFERFTKKNGLADDRIRVLCYSKNFHCLLAGSYEGVNTIRDKIITCSTGEIFDKNFNCVTGLVDAGKFIYIITYGFNSPIRYYPDENKFISAFDSGVYYPPDSYSGYLALKGDTVFSFGTKGVRIFNREGMVQNDTLGQVFGITEDIRGDLWLASWSFHTLGLKGGVYRYDGKTFRNYKDAFGITDREIWTVFCDHEQDILWIGTLNEGLFMVPFTAITIYPASYFNLGQQKINDLYLDSKNRLWIPGNRELIRMAPDGSYSLMDKHPMILSYRRFWNDMDLEVRPTLGSTRLEARKTDAALLPDFEKRTALNFQKVIEDTDHSIVFSNELGLFCYNEKNRETDYLGPESTTYEFALMGSDTLIISGWEVTALYPKFRAVRSANDKLGEYPPSMFYSFTKEREPKYVNRLVKMGNRYWYASWVSGLWMSEGVRMVHFNKSDSTISNNLNDICFDEKDHVIFGSNTGEICIATYANDRLKINYRISRDNGLQGNSITWLLADQKGRLWAGTNLGLNCIDLDELYRTNKYIIRFLGEEDGYTGQFSKRAALDAEGNLWTGAGDQLLRLDTKSFLSSQIKPGKIILKSLEINNTPADSILKKGLDPWTSLPAGKLTLKHSENNLLFYFDILNYSNPGKDRFRYMLRGFNETWHQWGEGRRAVYTNLSPGRYTLCVESYNLRTLGQAEPLKVEFTILYPWWGLWYLQVLALVIVLALAVLIIHKYLEAERKKQRQKSEIEKKIAQLEMQALQAQMNPHFIFNCVNGIQYYVLANKMDEVLAYLSDFSKVVGESLANATLRMVPLEQEISFLNSYLRLEQMRFPDKFDYDIRRPGWEDAGIVMLPPMLVQPFAENAIRHGFMPMVTQGHLSIVFEEAGKELLKCTITDNGIGRDKARINEGSPKKNDRSHSALITETRIRLFNPPGAPDKYKIVYTDLFDDGKSCGLKVELFIPMEKGGGI